MSELLPVLMLFGPTAIVLLTCRYLNQRNARHPLDVTTPEPMRTAVT